MTTPSKPESPQVFLVILSVDRDGDTVVGACFDRGRALNLRDKLFADDDGWLDYRVEAWREGDTEGEEIKPD